MLWCVVPITMPLNSEILRPTLCVPCILSSIKLIIPLKHHKTHADYGSIILVDVRPLSSGMSSGYTIHVRAKWLGIFALKDVVRR